MNTTLFHDINRFAAKTAFLHGVLGTLAGRAGLVVLAVLLVLGVAEARLGHFRARPGLGASLWPLVALGVSLGAGELVGHVLDRARPDQVLHGIEVIGTPATGFSLPDLRATAAAAICVALVALGSRLIALLTLLAALVIGFSEIYVGAHFPLDELAGLALGAVVALLAVPLLRRSTATAGAAHRPPSLTAELAGLGRAGSLAQSGPAATPVPLAATGAVRLLEAPAGGEVGTLPPPRLAGLQPAEWLRTTSAAPASPASATPGGAGSAGAVAAAGAKAGPLPNPGGGSPIDQVATIAVFPRPPRSDSPS